MADIVHIGNMATPAQAYQTPMSTVIAGRATNKITAVSHFIGHRLAFHAISAKSAENPINMADRSPTVAGSVTVEIAPDRALRTASPENTCSQERATKTMAANKVTKVVVPCDALVFCMVSSHPPQIGR